MNPKLRVAMLAVMLVAVVGFMVVVARRSPPPAAPVPPGPGPRVVAKPVPPPPDPAVAAVATVRDSGRSYEDRMKAVQGLPPTLTAEQCLAVRELVRDHTATPALRNDALNTLETQTANPQAGLVTELLTAWNDTKDDATWRDFALQHLAVVHERAAPEERQQAETLLLTVAQDEASPSAGTALLSLERLGRRDAALGETTRKLAKETLAAGGSNTARRLTALCVCINAGDREILPLARQTVQETGAAARFRMACVGALGELGDASDVATLEALTKDKDSRVRTAATTQLASLKRRLGQ